VPEPAPKKEKSKRKETLSRKAFRIEVGRSHGVTPSQIVGAIANEAGLEARFIGQIDIFDRHSMVELPDGMPREVFEHLQKVRVAGQPLRISRGDDAAAVEPVAKAPRQNARPRTDGGSKAPRRKPKG
jgi:ATP-dependent RNA helicase DeaD